MAQAEFTKDEAEAAMGAAEALFKGLPEGKQGDYYLGYLNVILLFLRAAKKAAPE